MKSLILFRPMLAAATLLSLIAAGAAGAARAEDAPPNPVVATVNGEEITEADLGLAVQDFRETLAQLPPDQRLDALINGIIDIRLMARAAEAAGLDKGEEAARRIAFVRDRALRAEYLRSKVFDTVTDEAIQARYDAEAAAFVPVDEIKASHILVETEDEAKAIIAELDNGGDFAVVAKAKSLDLGSGANGGDLDFFAHGRMVKSFEDAAFALDVGAYTKTPVKSDFGWHVIKVVDKRKSSPPALDQRRNELRDAMAKELFLAAVEQLRQGATIEIVPQPAPEPAPGEAPAPPQQ
ncbi:MAG: peptidylprolyl isomerase [Bauldia sp.]|nr:peptidylprolyl isomerase [Bauldia sp.]